MNDSDSSGPRRRVRYSGKNPKAFADKYKEHAPNQYPADVAKVLAAGKTPAGTHRPIMVQEVLQTLAPQPGECVLDCTMGYGGHACALLPAIQPLGRYIGMDIDAVESARSQIRLRELGYPVESIVVRRANFADVTNVVAAESNGGVNMILADLGVSSMQLDDPERGFSFKLDGPLDMRMNQGRGMSAAALLSKLNAIELNRIMEENSDQTQTPGLAKAILDSHTRKKLESTLSLAQVIRNHLESQHPTKSEEIQDTIRRVFQSLRIAVNDEFRVLEALLNQIPGCLVSGGRVTILSFHSGEDRRVKNAFKRGVEAGIYRSISTEVTRPSLAEQRDNPRSKSTKMRFAIRA